MTIGALVAKRKFLDSHGGCTDFSELLSRPRLSIDFIGASVTAQRGSWADVLHAQLLAQPTRQVEARKLAMGGVGVLFALANTAYKGGQADITFLEFSTGDVTPGHAPQGYLMEMLEALTARLLGRGTQLIIVHNWRKDYRGSLGEPVRGEYRKVAEKYGLLEIHNDQLIDHLTETSQINEEEFFRDICHTTDKGAQLYAAHVHEILKSSSACAQIRLPATNGYDGSLKEIQFYFFDDIFRGYGFSGASYVYPGTGEKFIYIELGENASAGMQVSGIVLGIAFMVWPQAGWLGIFVDGKLVKRIRCLDQHGYYERFHLLPAEMHLNNQSLEFRVLGEPVDFSISKERHPDFDKERRIRLVAIVGRIEVLKINGVLE